jgi:hypothetical protein
VRDLGLRPDAGQELAIRPAQMRGERRQARSPERGPGWDLVAGIGARDLDQGGVGIELWRDRVAQVRSHNLGIGLNRLVFVRIEKKPCGVQRPIVAWPSMARSCVVRGAK